MTAKLLVAVLGAALLAALGWWFVQRSAPPSIPVAAPVLSPVAKIYTKWCSDCHSTETGPGSLALQRKYGGNPPAILEQRSDLNPDYVKQVVRHGISFMPSFRKTEISDAELDLLAQYLAPTQDARGGSKPK